MQGLLKKPQALYAMVLSPTRELAIQIAEQFEALGSGIGVKCAVLVGGIDMMAQAIALGKRPHVIVGTPGRVVDHLSNTKARRPSACSSTHNVCSFAIVATSLLSGICKQSFPSKDLKQYLMCLPDVSCNVVIMSAPCNDHGHLVVACCMHSSHSLHAKTAGLLFFKASSHNKASCLSHDISHGYTYDLQGFSLKLLKHLVLDEADRLLNMDFEQEIDQILKAIPKV